MRYLITLLIATLAAVAGADTLQQRLDALKAATGVLDAIVRSDAAPVSGFGTLHTATIEYYSFTGDTATKNLVALVGSNDAATGDWYWVTLPEPLRPETKYLSGRTTGGWAALSGDAQATAIENFCNDVYEAANTGAQDIREFSVSPIKSDTVKVSGYFDIGTTWQRQDWYIRLIDPNGSVAAPYSNIEFQRVAAE